MQVTAARSDTKKSLENPLVSGANFGGLAGDLYHDLATVPLREEIIEACIEKTVET